MVDERRGRVVSSWRRRLPLGGFLRDGDFADWSSRLSVLSRSEVSSLASVGRPGRLGRDDWEGWDGGGGGDDVEEEAEAAGLTGAEAAMRLVLVVMGSARAKSLCEEAELADCCMWSAWLLY